MPFTTSPTPVGPWTGTGVFAAPTAIADEVARQYKVQAVGEVEEVRERFYAISIERRLRHPAVVAISQAAREDLFFAAPARRRGTGSRARGSSSG